MRRPRGCCGACSSKTRLGRCWRIRAEAGEILPQVVCQRQFRVMGVQPDPQARAAPGAGPVDGVANAKRPGLEWVAGLIAEERA
ncbi:MAG: hypothetical protein RI514_01580 [Spiribacter sp.]|nr:hypothetical protein [Spiribacter sp.]